MGLAQFFPQAPDYKDGMDEWSKLREQAKKTTLDQIFRDNIATEHSVDPQTGVVTKPGDLDQAGFYKDVANSGILGPEEFPVAMNAYLGQKQGATTAIALDLGNKQMGVQDPVVSRNGAQVGEPAITMTPAASSEPKNPLVPAAAPSPDGQAPAGSWFDQLKAKTQQPAPDQAQIAAQTAPPPGGAQPDNRAALARLFGMKDANGQDLGSSTLQANQAAPPPSPVGQLPPLPPQSQGTISQAPDNRTELQTIEDSANSASGAPGSDGPQNGDYSKVFDYSTVQDTAGAPIKSGIDAALSKLGQQPGQAGVNALLQLADSTVPPAGPQYTDGKYDQGKTLASFRGRPALISAARKEMINSLASGNTVAIGEIMQARDQALSQLNQQNAVTEKNAAASGTNDLASKVTQIGNSVGLPGRIDPTSFKSAEELDAFGKQATAYAAMKSQVAKLPADGFTDPLEVVNFAKSYTQAEGLGEAEGTRNLITLLSTKDPAARALLQSVMGKGEGVMNQAIQTVLMSFRPADLAKLADGMKFQGPKGDWFSHTGTGSQPILQKYANPDAPKTLGQIVGTGLPRPSGKDDPIYTKLPSGAHFISPSGIEKIKP